MLLNKYVYIVSVIGCVLFVFLFISNSANAATITWDGGGADNNWSTALNWDTDTVPGASDDVVFNATSTDDSIIDSSHGGTVSSLTISSAYSGTITQSRTVDIIGAGGYAQAGGTYDMNSLMLVIGAYNPRVTVDFVMTGGTFKNTGSGNWLEIYGDFNVTNCIIDTSFYELDAYGDMTFGTGVTWPSDSVFILWYDDLATGQILDVDGSLEIYDFWIYGDGAQSIAAGDTIIVTNELEISSSGLTTSTGAVIEVTGNILQIKPNEINANIKFTGSSNQTINSVDIDTGVNDLNIEVDKSSGTVTFIGNNVGAEEIWDFDLTITNGAVVATNYIKYFGTITVASGSTFTHESSGIFQIIDDSTISGDVTFYDLSLITIAKTLTVASGSTITVSNDFTVTGTSGNEIVLVSGTPGTRWNLDVTGTPTVEYVNVTDSDASSGTYINPTNSTNGGNNLNWFTLSTSSGSSYVYMPPKTYEVTLLTPNGGESLVYNEIYPITWETSGSGPTSAIDIHYTIDNGESFEKIATLEDDDGYYDWTIPNLTCSEVLIRIEGTDLADPVSEDWSDDSFEIQGLEEQDLDSNPKTCSNPEISIGDFVRSDEFPTVYYISNECERKVFINSQVFFTWADSFDEINFISSEDLDNYALTGVMLPKPGIVLVKIQSNPKVYAIDETEDDTYILRWVHSEALAIELYGNNWSDYVIDLEPTFFTHFTIGPDTSLDSPTHDLTIMKKRVELF